MPRAVYALWDVERPIVHVWADNGEPPAVGAIYELPEDAGSMAGSWRVLSHEAEPPWQPGRVTVRVNVIRTENYAGPKMTASVDAPR